MGGGGGVQKGDRGRKSGDSRKTERTASTPASSLTLQTEKLLTEMPFTSSFDACAQLEFGQREPLSRSGPFPLSPKAPSTAGPADLATAATFAKNKRLSGNDMYGCHDS